LNRHEFDQMYYAGNGQDADRPALRFYTRLARRFFVPGRVLDFGSGTGFFLKRLSHHFLADGLEVSEHGLRHTRLLLPHAQLYAALDELSPASYAGITALHVLEHIPDEELVLVLAAWRRALLPKGRVLCVVPELHGKGHRLKGASWCGFGDPSHVNLKGREAWKSFLTGQGFRIIKSGTDGLWDFPYQKNCPRLFDLLRYAPATLIQFLAGRLLLGEGQGESLVLLLEITP
jgi:SAM-dependent methyltransferase